MKKEKRVQFLLDEDMEQWLRDEAKRRRCSISQIVRDLLLKAMEASR